MKPQTRYPGTQAVTRAIRLLKAFRHGPIELSIGELSAAAGLPRSTVYRLLSVLSDEGFVIQDGRSGKYRLGPEFVVLGGLALQQTDVRQAALPHMRALAASTGETIDLEILHGLEVLIIEEVAGRHVLNTGGTVATLWPAHATATGKVLLAYLPADELDRRLPDKLPALTSHTITDPDQLRAELACVRDQGYAIAAEELEPHLIAIGAPIFDASGQVTAALSISGPRIRIPPEQVPKLTRQLVTTTADISADLGYTYEQHPTR
ncbi:MAG TPA: IclR family transcriptional regulator [Anaerolineae bacterium]|nr:IclR family transcriptional regulator [Anaerolineae bacterium]